MSARYVCRHGRTEPARDDGNPWCVECECAPFVTDDDVRPLRKALEAWHPPGPAQARDLMAIEVAARRRAEKAMEDAVAGNGEQKVYVERLEARIRELEAKAEEGMRT